MIERTMKRKKIDFIEQLIEVSDKCLTMHPRIKPNGKLQGYSCNCRANVKRILRKWLESSF